MRSYEAARSLFSFLGACSWFVIAVGAIVALGGASVGSGLSRNAGALQALLGAAPGIILAMLGFFGLALVQMGRANVDTAEYGQQALQVARDQLEVSRQSLQQGKQLAASYATQAVEKPPVAAAPTADKPADAGSSYDSRAVDTTSVGTSNGRAQINSASKGSVLPSPDLEIPTPELLGEKVKVAGRDLVLVDGTYRYGSMGFSSLEKAEAYFSQMGVNPSVKLTST